jgi:phenylalanyl-tRNA synthetase beta chain
MKFSYRWLQKLSGTKKSPEQLAELLTMKAFEVESVENIGRKFDGVVVGEIKKIEKHPNADRLSFVEVNVGKDKILKIVCGASNIQVGQKVPVATVGTKLPNGMEIKEADIRGIKSFGMLCAEDELGLGKNHAGIMILENEDMAGISLAKALGVEDYVMDIKVLPDRSHDALSHIGMAREICALEGKKLQYDYEKLKISAKKTQELKVEVKDKKLCLRYIGAVMENIKVKNSAEWIGSYLKALGINSISNIVDATNFPMLEIGNPMHAFDFDKIKNNAGKVNIIVRLAKNGEKIKLLDGTEKILSDSDLVIASEEKILALAGIMGGENSGITAETKKIVLECGSFDPVSIRKTRVRLGIKTDSSDRFEKGLDPNLAEKTMARSIKIIETISEGESKLTGVIDIYPKPVKPWKIKLDLNYVNNLLGEKIPTKAVNTILKSLGLSISGKTITIPTFRIDLETQEDLIEEIGRIYGYEKIQTQIPAVALQTAKMNSRNSFSRKVKNILVGIGFSEVYNYSFYSQKDAKSAGLQGVKHLELENPMNPDQALLRTSLIPGILKNIKENLKNFKEFQIFEIGKTYFSGQIEKNILAGAVVLEKDAEADSFYQAKGFLEALLESLGAENYIFESGKGLPSLWHPARSAEIKINNNIIGQIGEVSPAILSNFDIEKRVAVFKIDLAEVEKNCQNEKIYKSIPKYPSVVRDIALIAEKETAAQEIINKIKKTGGKLIKDVEIFDVFKKDGKTSLAFHIVFQSLEKTLESKEADEMMQRIYSVLEKESQVKIRK